jgi:lipopolysaccharide transport system ATP-binding protein
MTAPSIAAHNLGKSFHLRRHNRAYTLHEALTRGWRSLQREQAFWAMRNVCFTVMPGEALGVIGKNGAGKSTLLMLLSKVLEPSEGSIETVGHVGALLDLQAVLHPELTGRENTNVGAIIAGLSRAEVRQRSGSIASFAELESEFDNPVRTYSFGMQMRLAFAIAVHADPQILLIDEHLAVGDYRFQEKCLQRIRDMRDNGCTVVLISHNMDHIKEHCDRVLVLERGRAVDLDQPGAAVERYLAAEHADQQKCLPTSQVEVKS